MSCNLGSLFCEKSNLTRLTVGVVTSYKRDKEDERKRSYRLTVQEN